ncbi:MAG: hypothetical protein IPO91_05955 [Chloroflexi bacterium]|nr:hypothetical protein [Chloroflexota bacterium]
MTQFCSDCSVEAGEKFFASAPRTEHWILVEYTGAWGAKAIPESDLAPEVKAKLNGWADNIPFTKVLFIKQGAMGATVRVFVALTNESSPVLYKFELASYEALLSFDLDAVLRRDPQFDANVQRDPLVLVCTNGRRDVSCAKYGLPVYTAFAEQTPGWAWEVTHVGGHRFAGTLVTLPDGVMYGRISPDDVSALVAAQRNRALVVEKTRGRAFFDAPVQAAEYFLRGSTGIATLSGVCFESIRQPEENVWSVRFSVAHDNELHEVHVRREMSPWTVYESTTDEAPRQVPQFHLVEQHTVRRKAPRCEG